MTSLFSHMSSKLRPRGSLQVLTDFDESSKCFTDLELIGTKSGFHLESDRPQKEYFSKNIRESYFIHGSKVQTLIFNIDESKKEGSNSTTVD